MGVGFRSNQCQVSLVVSSNFDCLAAAYCVTLLFFQIERDRDSTARLRRSVLSTSSCKQFTRDEAVRLKLGSCILMVFVRNVVHLEGLEIIKKGTSFEA